MAQMATVLKVLISSKQLEFQAERSDILNIMKSLPLLAADAAEEWSPEAEAVQNVSVRQASGCSIYIGLFGCIYSYPTILEYEAAAQNPYREMLVYVKDCPNRDESLAAFLEKVKDPTNGRTLVTYRDWESLRSRVEKHLWDAVGRMVEHLLRLGHPPVALGSGGAMERRWRHERQCLIDLGLPSDRELAVRFADGLRQQRPG
jgi:hypothetical protein